MAIISKYVKLDKNILLEYTYNEGNLIGEPYNILVDSRDRRQSYIAGSASATGNTIGNQLFRVDTVSGRYAKVNPSIYSFLQLRDFSSGLPVRHDILKFHIPVNWTFGEYLGFYVKIYAFDTTTSVLYDISNFYFDMTDIGQQYLLNYTSPPLLFQEKLWGKNIQIEIPALADLSGQRSGNVPKPNTINANLTNARGLNSTTPIFIDFHFIKSIQTINSITSYLLTPKVTTTVPQTPEFERLGLVIKHSENGDFFEVYGTYNNTVTGFSQFIDESYNLGHRYYVQYNITMYEQNVRGKTTTVTQYENFNETIEYRPIIKYSSTTAIVDVEMRLIDAVDDSYVLRRASYGMLQDEVAKYSAKLMKINLSDAYKPKIYNIKNSIDPSLVGFTNSFGKITLPKSQTRFAGGIVANANTNTGFGGFNNGTMTNAAGNSVVVETVNIPFPVLAEKFNVIGKSDNATLNKDTFFGNGKITVLIYPFENILKFVIADGQPTSPKYYDLTAMGEVKLQFKSDADLVEVPIYSEAQMDMKNGQVAFRIQETKVPTLKKIYQSGVNLFYITTTAQSMTSVLYTGLFKIFDNPINVAQLNAQAPSSAASPDIIRDPNLPRETAIITRKPIVKETAPIPKPGGFASTGFGKSLVSSTSGSSNAPASSGLAGDTNNDGVLSDQEKFLLKNKK